MNKGTSFFGDKAAVYTVIALKDLNGSYSGLDDIETFVFATKDSAVKKMHDIVHKIAANFPELSEIGIKLEEALAIKDSAIDLQVDCLSIRYCGNRFEIDNGSDYYKIEVRKEILR